MTGIADHYQRLSNDLKLLEPIEQLEFLAQQAIKLSPVAPEDQNLLVQAPGCASHTAVGAKVIGKKLLVYGESVVVTTRGSLYLLMKPLQEIQVSELKVEEIEPTLAHFLTQSGLTSHLTPRRSQGWQQLPQLITQQIRKAVSVA